MPPLHPLIRRTISVPEHIQALPVTFFQTAFIFLVSAASIFLLHASLLRLPFFWDEAGQFIPTALDLLRHGWWVTRSAIPNVHPPGVEFYLVLWYKVFGYSILVTRVAMLFIAAEGLLLTFLLAIELTRGLPGLPALLPPVLLFFSPLFYMQSFMAQLDMPAMVFTLLALISFLREKYKAAALASIVLVLVKETGLVTPIVFFLILMWRRDWKRSCYFIAPAVALVLWLLVLHRATGYWLGDPGFAHYNVAYSLNPVRIVCSVLRRLYYLFIAEFRWIGSLALILAARAVPVFRQREWVITFWVAIVNLILVSILGGAELERYLLPVLPLLYIAFAVAFTRIQRPFASWPIAGLLTGLFVNLFWNPPYPFPYENNYAMVDFIRLEHSAAEFAERSLAAEERVATAWPYTAGFRNPDYGFVHRKVRTVETNDFNVGSIRSIDPAKFNVLITYTRTWAPEHGVISIPFVRELLSHFYAFDPPITAAQCEQIGLFPRMSWSLRGQTITVYIRRGTAYKL